MYLEPNNRGQFHEGVYLMFLAEIIVSDQAVQSLNGRIDSLIRLVVYVVIAVVAYQVIKYGWAATAKKITDAYSDLKNSIQLKPTEKTEADRAETAAPTQPAKRTDKAAVVAGLPSNVLLDSIANDSAVTDAQVQFGLADGKRYELKYSIREVTANG
jgi:hypothetical protein